MEEGVVLHTVELHQVALKVLVDDHGRDTPLVHVGHHPDGLIARGRIADVLLHHDVRVAPLEPAGKGDFHGESLVSGHYPTLWMRHTMGKQEFRHGTTHTIQYASRRVGDAHSPRLPIHQQGKGMLVASHRHHHLGKSVQGSLGKLVQRGTGELVLGVRMYSVPHAEQLLHYLIIYSSIVSHMVGRETGATTDADDVHIFFSLFGVQKFGVKEYRNREFRSEGVQEFRQ